VQSDRRIINVDESIITITEHRKGGWLIAGVKNKATMAQRPGQLNIIAGISSVGELFFTVNRGKNNANTFELFIIKLVEHLNSKNRKWRDNTVIMLDNAPYHRSHYVRSKLTLLKVPLMYLGPYHFKLAPIEVFFSYMKSHNLNPLSSRITSK
jgi:hypothetical protein